jgi:hypothetical protein
MQARRTEAETFRAAPSGRRMLAADGCASSLSDPACCFCAVWAPAGRGEWRSPCSNPLEADGLIQVFDVWESEASFQAFGKTLLPIMADLGADPGRPQTSPVHNLIKG